MQYGSFLLNKVLNVQECDATGLHSSTSAGNQKHPLFKFLIACNISRESINVRYKGTLALQLYHVSGIMAGLCITFQVVVQGWLLQVSDFLHGLLNYVRHIQKPDTVA